MWRFQGILPGGFHTLFCPLPNSLPWHFPSFYWCYWYFTGNRAYPVLKRKNVLNFIDVTDILHGEPAVLESWHFPSFYWCDWYLHGVPGTGKAYQNFLHVVDIICDWYFTRSILESISFILLIWLIFYTEYPVLDRKSAEQFLSLYWCHWYFTRNTWYWKTYASFLMTSNVNGIFTWITRC